LTIRRVETDRMTSVQVGVVGTRFHGPETQVTDVRLLHRHESADE